MILDDFLNYRSEGFPNGIFHPSAQSDGKIVDVSPPPPSASSGNSGRHSGQEAMIGGFPMVLGSWCEIVENGDRGSTQNFAADVVSIVVWPGEPSLET